MRSFASWERIYRAIYNGAYAVWRRRTPGGEGYDDVDDVVATCLLSFWEKTPADLSEAHQASRAWHFGANGMRNHLRRQRARHNPHNPHNQVHWDEVGDVLTTDLTPARALEARQCLEQLQAHLAPGDWNYMLAACSADNQADLARSLGVSRSAVSKRLRLLRHRIKEALALGE